MYFLNKILILLNIFISIIPNVMAKDQNGGSFRASYVPTFLQRDFVGQLNSLQVLAPPLSGEPFLSEEKSAINYANDDFKKLLAVFPQYTNIKTNIYELDELSLHSGKSQKTAWSYHSFPTYKGGLAYRYLDPYFANSEDWQAMFQQYETNLPQTLISSNQISTLSPMEKYEYLVGNTDFNLTKDQWIEGQKYLKAHGEIPDWFGLCNGTAPATINNPRPKNAIYLKSFDKKNNIIFYPSDIKALVAYAWAVSGGPSEMMGGRCEVVVQPGTRPPLNCLDTNPGSFHMAVINLLGLHGQPFIMDSSAGPEVWNRSVVSYRYNYFRPGTRNLTDKIQYALIPLSEYKNDPYAQYRSAGTTHIVGVSMELTYLIGNKPSASLSDSPEQDVYDKATYWYNLELNQAGIVLGGEWQENQHPDFIWVVASNYAPKNIYDYVVGNGLLFYDGKQSISSYIAGQAQMAAKEGKVLFTLLEAMLRLSQ